jgi:hypothetical protein
MLWEIMNAHLHTKQNTLSSSSTINLRLFRMEAIPALPKNLQVEDYSQTPQIIN